MKKANKILMASVAILLSLVLITTSVVSGVFAKFAIKKTTAVGMTLEKLGVTVTMTPNSNLGHTKITNGDSISIALNDISLLPGEMQEVVSISMSGTAKTRLKIILDVDFVLENPNDFIVPAGVGGLDEDAFVMPYYISDEHSTMYSPQMGYGYNYSIGAIEENFFTNLSYYYGFSDKLDTEWEEQNYYVNPFSVCTISDESGNVKDAYAEQILEKGETAGFYDAFWGDTTTINIRLHLHKVSVGSTDSLKQFMWLMEQNPSLQIVYTVTVEQA